MKRIAILTPGLGLGGAEQWIRSLVSGCRDFAWTVGNLSTDYDHPLVVSAVSRHSRLVFRGSPAETAAEVVKDADAVICWGGGNYWPLPTRAPVVFVGHGSCQWTVRATAQARDGGATHYVGVSERVAEAMRAAVPRVAVILNGVDASRLSVPADRHAIRDRWKPNRYDYERYVGYFGRLGDEKNLDSLIYAVAALPHHYQLVLVGCTGWRRERILTLARSVLPGRLIEVPATDVVGEQLGGLDCLVQVSPREGHSLSLCEAWLCGVPVISNRTGAIPELERLAGHELIESLPIEPTTIEIADKIRSVCASFPNSRTDAAAAFAQKHLTADVMCGKWSAFLRQTIPQPRPSA